MNALIAAGYAALGPVGLVLQVGSLLGGRSARKKASRAEAAARAEEAKQRILEARRQRVQMAQEQQKVQAQTRALAAATGTQGSSGEATSIASTRTQLGANSGYLSAYDLFGRRAAGFAQESMNQQSRSDRYQSLFELGQIGMSYRPMPRPAPVAVPMGKPNVSYEIGKP